MPRELTVAAPTVKPPFLVNPPKDNWMLEGDDGGGGSERETKARVPLFRLCCSLNQLCRQICTAIADDAQIILCTGKKYYCRAAHF